MPKIIHYFEEGTPDYNFRGSWKKHNPGYEMVHWSVANMPYEQYPFLEILRDRKKWSMMSDFTRHWAIINYGGFYLDTDIELVKPLDSLLGESSFVSVEGPPVAANAAASGGHVGAAFQKICLEELCKMDMEVLSKQFLAEVEVSPRLLTRLITQIKGREMDETDLNEIKDYGDFKTLPKKYFYPYNWNEQFDQSMVKDETIGIHWWKHSWK